MLDQFNFAGAVHSTLDDGKFPQSSNCTIRWTGDDDRSILAVGDVPLSAADAGSFLGLGVRLGEAIDSAHIAAAVFVHWPDETCESFDDLVRIANYGPLLGEFTSLNEYFESVYDPGYSDSFTADEYRSPFLKQAIDARSKQPISSFISYWRQHYQLATCRALLVQLCAMAKLDSNQAADFQLQIDQLQNQIERQVNQSGTQDSGQAKPDADQRAESLLQSLLNEPSQKDASPDSTIRTIINPTSTRRRIETKTPSRRKGTLKKEPPIVLCDSQDQEAHWVVELPPMGSVMIDADSIKGEDQLRSDPLVGEGLKLRNEFFELLVDEKSGGIRSIQLYEKRVNLSSQQLSIRIPSSSGTLEEPLSKARYATMVADKIELKMESQLAGRIVSTGRLMDENSVLAEYEQSVRVARGNAVIELEISLDLKESLSHSLNHYVCSRLAWKDESSRMIANASEIRHEVNTDWFHATNYLEIVQAPHRLTMLTGGLPFHRRVSRRMVDSVLVVGNETQRCFKFGLGVNISHPLSAAANRMTPTIEFPTLSGFNGQQAGKNSSSWLFHFNCKNILASWWQPFFDKEKRWAGVDIRLKETEGRAGRLGIVCPRQIASGEQTNFAGDFLHSLDVASDDPSKLEMDFGRFDFFQISIRWKQ